MTSLRLEEYVKKVKEIEEYVQENIYAASFPDLHIENTSQGNFSFNSTLLFPLLTPFVNKGSVMLAGGIGGGKTTYLKCVGALLTNQPLSDMKSLRDIERSILRCHPQTTEEEAIGRFDYSDLLGSPMNFTLSIEDLKKLKDPVERSEVKVLMKDVAREIAKITGPKETVVWRMFVDPNQPWKIADEINLLSAYQQNMFLPILGEGIAKYTDYAIPLKSFSLTLTMNLADQGTFEVRRAFFDRIALSTPALQASAPDQFLILREGQNEKLQRKSLNEIVNKGPKLGEMSFYPVWGCEANTAMIELPKLIDENVKLEPGSDAELFMIALGRELTQCERCTGLDKGQAADIKPTTLCTYGSQCSYKTSGNVCYTSKTGVSVRAIKDCLYPFSKALCAYLGLEKVELPVVKSLSAYVLLHRIEFSEEYTGRTDFGNRRLDFIKQEIVENVANKLSAHRDMYEIWSDAIHSDKRKIKDAIYTLGKMKHLVAIDYINDLEKRRRTT